jgi:hypothetical protein
MSTGLPTKETATCFHAVGTFLASRYRLDIEFLDIAVWGLLGGSYWLQPARPGLRRGVETEDYVLGIGD